MGTSCLACTASVPPDFAACCSARMCASSSWKKLPKHSCHACSCRTAAQSGRESCDSSLCAGPSLVGKREKVCGWDEHMLWLQVRTMMSIHTRASKNDSMNTE